MNVSCQKGLLHMAKQVIQHQCSFCKRVINVRDQYDLPIYDPNTGFANCVL